MPKCKICGYESRSLQPHLKHKHQMKVKEYYEAFNGAPVYDYNPADRLKEWAEREPERAHQVKSEAAKRNVQVMIQYCRDHPDELREFRRANGLKVGARKDNNLQRWRDKVGPDVVSQNCAVAGHLSSLSKGHELMARTALSNNRYCKYPYCSEKFSNISRSVFASKWEVNFISLCETIDQVVELDNEPFGIPYIYEGKEHKYYPDFIVNCQTVVEIKPEGRKSDEIVQLKAQAAEKYCKTKGLTYLILTEALLPSLRNGEITTSAQQELVKLLKI